MELKELKNMIAVIESGESNIKMWEALKGRELCIIPTDSEYFKAFQKYEKENLNGRYDRNKEQAPLYISGKSRDEFLSNKINRHLKHIEPYKEKIKRILNTNNPTPQQSE